MVTPQALLGLGLALPLLAIGGYVAWLAQRVDDLESRTPDGPGPRDSDEEGPQG